MQSRKNSSSEEFHEYYLDSSIPGMIWGLTITLSIFIVFTILDKILFPESVKNIFFNRFGIIFPFIIASIITVSLKSLRKYRETLLTIINLLTGAGIFIVGAFSGPDVAGYEYFFVWTSLVILGIHAFYRIRLRNLYIIGFVLLFSFIGANYHNGNYLIHPERFTNELFFVIAMSVLGIMISYTIEQLKRNDFLQQVRLREQYEDLVAEVQKKQEAEEALHHTEKLYHDSLDSIPDIIYIVDKDLRFVFYNKAFEKACIENGFTSNFIGKKMQSEFPVLNEITFDEMREVFKTGKILLKEEKIELTSISYSVQSRKIPIYKDHEIIQVMVIVQDISKKMELEELKQKSTEQKDILLREIHHRVKNNLAIVISLLSLQMRKNDNPEIVRTIRDIELRIRSMALIHEFLYKSDNLDRIPLATYIRSLAMLISGTYCPPHVQIVNDLEPVDVSIETAMPLGLITNELLTNSCKYGYPDQRIGTISIKLGRSDGHPDKYRLCVTDDGIGLPEGFSVEQESSLGMFIVRILVEQLNAQLTIVNKKGTSFTIDFSEVVMKKTKLPA
jgi:two-component sensor histidine kinase/PAS domain-containing protein